MAIQRVDVITGRESRRFSDVDKRQIVEEAFQPGVNLLETKRITRVPVVRDRKIVGIVSHTNLV